MLGNDDRGTQFPVDLLHRIQEIRCGDGIQLAGRLIQNQYTRLHSHDGCQIQQLLLAAGQFIHILVEPSLDAEVTGHFCHPQTDGFLICPQAFQSKGQFMPDLVCDDLVIRILHHVANPGGLGTQIRIF